MPHAKPPNLTAAEAREYFDYGPDTGEVRWRHNTSPWGRMAGRVAGCPNGLGYIVIQFRGRLLQAHRLIWLLQTGMWPRDDIDHVNGIRSDNRWANLRAATPGENCRNRRIDRRNKSGVKGVCRVGGKWRAQITVNYQVIILGHFDDKREAAVVRRAAERLFHGEYARPL